MASCVPLEGEGPLLLRWLNTVIHGFRKPRAAWDDVSCGGSVLAAVAYAYTWVLLILPLVLGCAQMGRMATRAQFGPYAGMSMVNSLQGFGGILLLVLLNPAIVVGAGGTVVHGMLRLMGESKCDPMAKTLRAVGYGYAWMMPFLGVVVAIRTYFLFNPLAGLDSSQSGLTLGPVPSAATIWVGIADLLLSICVCVWLVWGTARTHRAPVWKVLVAWIPGGLAVMVGTAIVYLLGNAALVGLIINFVRR